MRFIVFTGIILSLLCSSAYAETLQQVWVTVYRDNPELAAARAKLRAEDEQVAGAMSGWRPDISATAEKGISQQHVSGNGFAEQDESLSPGSIGINVTQPVFKGFRTTAQVRAAEASVKAARAGLQKTEQKILLDAARAYIDVVTAEAILSLQRENENVLQRKHAEVADRLRIQELTKTDLAQAQSRLSEAAVARLQAEGELAARRAGFMRIAGTAPEGLVWPEMMLLLPPSLEMATTLALQNHPDMTAATFSADAARENITEAKGRLLPEVNLIGQASHAMDQGLSTPDEQDNAALLLRMTIPLYKTGVDYARTRAAQQSSLQKSLELDDVRNKVREQAARAWYALATARAAQEGRLRVVAAAEDALKGVETEAKFGTRTTLDILNAQQELQAAKIGLAQAQREAFIAMLELKSATGGLTAEALNLPVTHYDPAENYETVRNTWAGFSDMKE